VLGEVRRCHGGHVPKKEEGKANPETGKKKKRPHVHIRNRSAPALFTTRKKGGEKDPVLWFGIEEA